MADGQPLRKPPAFRDPTTPIPPPPPQQQQPQQPVGPRKPAVPPAFYQTKRKKRGCCRICCCCICCILVFLIIILAILGGLFFLWFQPKVPIFRFRPLELTRFNVTVKPDGTALLDSKAIIRVEVKNPNSKLKIYYGETEVSLTLDEETQLGSGILPAFVQPTTNVTLLKFTADTDNLVIDSTTGSKLQKGVKSGDVKVNAAVKTKVGIGFGKVKIGMLAVNVDCGGVTLNQLGQGDTPPKCTFNTLRWITIH